MREDGTVVTALLLVDAQRNMLDPPTPVPDAPAIRAALEKLLVTARSCGAVVVHVQNDGESGDPDEPGSSGWELAFVPTDGEIVTRKDQPDAFVSNPSLADELAKRGVSRVVLAGMQSNYCVAATSRAAMQHGFDVVLASGAHATYDEERPAAVISAEVEAALAEEGILVVPAPDVSFDSQ